MTPFLARKKRGGDRRKEEEDPEWRHLQGLNSPNTRKRPNVKKRLIEGQRMKIQKPLEKNFDSRLLELGKTKLYPPHTLHLHKIGRTESNEGFGSKGGG